MFEHTLLNEYEAAGLAEDESHKVRYVCRQVRNGRICEHEQQTYKDNPCAHGLRGPHNESVCVRWAQ